MNIILRKIAGRLTPLFRLADGRRLSVPANAAGMRAGSEMGLLGALSGFLLSPLVLTLLVFCFALAWSAVHPATASAHSVSLIGLAGTVQLRELRAKRANLATELRAIVDGAEKEKRGLNAEEETRYAKLFGDVDELRKQIERGEQLAELERSLASDASDRTPPAPAAGSPEARANPRATEEYRSAFASFISRGYRGMSPDEQRALSIGSDVGGGFTAAAEQFVQGLIKGVDNIAWIRQLATIIPVPTAVSLGAMTLDADPADADWTSEIQTGSEDSTMAFGRRKLSPHPLAKRIKVSKDYLRQTLTGGETLVRNRLAYKFGITQEKGFMTGTGQQQALGLFTASADGISTGRDISAGNTSTSPTFDGLLAAKYALKTQYWNDKLRWIFHRDAMLKITQLKDTYGQYLWRESVRAGEPDTILNIRLAVSEYCPNTFTTGLYVGLLGNLEYYWIADAYDVAIQRLDELYAETNQVGFIGRASVDGQPVLEEAFARVKLG